ncbi:MAG: YqaE/Pmp3 family membrane protein [Gammaproteobacteria bacterium]|nr:YqaE/Pmp3 family membrane protein [Gammaproteobacteria bacterium]
MSKQSDQDLLRIIIAILLPPVAAYLQVGVSLHLFINIVLTLFGYLPGIAHALWLIITKQKG